MSLNRDLIKRVILNLITKISEDPALIFTDDIKEALESYLYAGVRASSSELKEAIFAMLTDPNGAVAGVALSYYLLTPDEEVVEKCLAAEDFVPSAYFSLWLSYLSKLTALYVVQENRALMMSAQMSAAAQQELREYERIVRSPFGK